MMNMLFFIYKCQKYQVSEIHDNKFYVKAVKQVASISLKVTNQFK